MFSREKCVEYAIKWALGFNPEYYNFTFLGGDCTNYVSQCLYAGGIEMNYLKYGWFYNSLNSRAPAWTGVDEFWNFAISNESVGVRLKQIDLEYLEIGDIIQLYNGNRFHHTLIVSEISNSIKVCSHDSPSLNRPLNDYRYKLLRCGKILN